MLKKLIDKTGLANIAPYSSLTYTCIMSEVFKYDGRLKYHATFMKVLIGAIGGLSFVYGKLNDKEPENLLDIVYMGEFLHRLP